MHLSGDAGIERMESALSETRSRYIRVKDSGSPVGFPMTQYMPPSPTPLTTVASPSERNISNKSNKTSRVVRSLFKDTD
ncbi:T-complex protein, partial [Trifolium medium]|nr:T-complex protein [Trifolium medium]